MSRPKRTLPIPWFLPAASAALAAVSLCFAPLLTQSMHAQTAGDAPPQTASVVSPAVAPASYPSAPVSVAVPANVISAAPTDTGAAVQPTDSTAVTVAAQPADTGATTVDAAPADQTQGQQYPPPAPRGPAPAPAPRGPMNVQGPARGPAPAKAVSVQGPPKGPVSAYPGRRAGGRRGGPARYGRGGAGPAVRPALAPRLPNAGTGGLLDSINPTSEVTPWMPVALLLIASALGGAGVLANKRGN